MKKIDLYIIRVILKPFFSTLFILVGMIWLLQSIRLMDLVINKNMAMLDFLAMSVLLMPSMLIVLLPLSFFSGVYSGLKKMVLDSEMDAIFAAGISRLNVLRPLFLLSLVFVGATYVISLYAMPAGRITFYEIKNRMLENADNLQLEAGTFNKIDKNITVYVEEIENNQWMKNIIVFDNSTKNSQVTWTAEEGVLKLDKYNKPNLFLLKGTRQEIGESQTSVLGFTSHQIDLSREVKEQSVRKKKAAELYLLELLDISKLTREKDIHKYTSEFYKRLLWPLAPVALMFIPLYFLFKPVKNRFGITKPSIVAIITAVGFIALQMFFNAQISSGEYSFIYLACILPAIVPAIFFGLLIKENLK